MVREEGKKQENIESITNKAIPHLSPEAKPEDIENDSITHFFDRSRLVAKPIALDHLLRRQSILWQLWTNQMHSYLQDSIRSLG
jgi:hypothetical protein